MNRIPSVIGRTQVSSREVSSAFSSISKARPIYPIAKYSRFTQLNKNPTTTTTTTTTAIRTNASTNTGSSTRTTETRNTLSRYPQWVRSYVAITTATAQPTAAASASASASSESEVVGSGLANAELHLTPQCIKRLQQIQATRLQQYQAQNPSSSSSASSNSPLLVALRVSVEGGGCSGFSYKFDLPHDPTPAADDLVMETDGVRVLVDAVSLPLLNGSTIDYEDELMRSAFSVARNPNSGSGCSCGTSFTPKSM